MNFDPTEHSYVEHPTYAGPGCAICGRHFAEHNSAIFTRTMTREQAAKQYGWKPGESGKEGADGLSRT